MQQLEETNLQGAPLRLAWDGGYGQNNIHEHNSRFPPQSQGFFQQLQGNNNSAMQMGYVSFDYSQIGRHILAV